MRSSYGLTPGGRREIEEADLERDFSLDRAYRTLALHEALIDMTEAVVRLTDSQYLVQWRPNRRLWCVIDMTAPDEHADSCSAFRYVQRCEHLDLICQFCSREQNRC